MSATAILKQFCPSLDSEIVEYINGKPHERERVGLRGFFAVQFLSTLRIRHMYINSNCRLYVFRQIISYVFSYSLECLSLYCKRDYISTLPLTQ